MEKTTNRIDLMTGAYPKSKANCSFKRMVFFETNH